MIKSELLSHINKYHLAGMVESVIWSVKDNIAQVKFVSQSNSTVGEIIFPFEYPENAEIGVFNTKALIGLLNIMKDDITISFEKEYDTWMKIRISDGVYEGTYSLADVRSIPDPGSVEEEPKTFEVAFVLNKEFKEQYLKAYKAIGTINRFTIQTMKKDIKFTLGEKTSYSNKVSFNIPCDDFLPIPSLAFSGETLAEILKCNPELGESTLEVSAEGLMKISIYGTGGDRVIYYLIQLEEV